MSPNIYVIVPEGLSKGDMDFPSPSFVYRKVIEYVANTVKKNDEVYFAPANSFGSSIEEQIAGLEYFKLLYGNINGIKLYSQKISYNKYVDTLGNAILLMNQFPRLISEEIELVSAVTHSKRVEYCFKNVGYKIKKVHRVKYKILDEKIVKRLWYYKYPIIHKIYEFLALQRDKLRIRLSMI